MKALILSTHTGGGHDAAARAVQEALEARGVDCRMEDCLAFGGKLLSKIVCNGYIKMVQHVPDFFGWLYRVTGEKACKRRSMTYALLALFCAPGLKKFLRSWQPDVILCTHVFAGQMVTHLKRHGGYDGRLMQIMTDYTAHPYSGEVDADLFCMSHESVRPECHAMHIADEQLYPCGIPVSLRCKPCRDKAAAKETAGFPTDRQEVLLVGGSMGAGNLPETLTALTKVLGSNAHLTVVCGSNEKMRASLAAQYDGDDRLTIRGRVVPLYPLMEAADVLVTKSGGLTTSEAMTIGTPMVIINPIEGCESANAAMFEKFGLAAYAHNTAEIAEKLDELLQDESKRMAMVDRQRRQIDAAAAEHIAQRCVELCRQAVKTQQEAVEA